jgi:pimeloyl-ACP methyl ester carboxylesterase
MGNHVTHEGVTFYYEDFGSGEPIVFVHGGGMSHEMWEQQVFALTDNFRTITYDQRGHGQSDKPRDGYTFSQETDDLEAVLKHCNVSRFHLVTHGLGSYVGLMFAHRHPDRVRGLMLVSGAACFFRPSGERGGFSTEGWAAYMNGMAQNKIEATAKLVNGRFFYRDPGVATRQAVLDTMLQWPLYSLKALAKDMESVDMQPMLSGLNLPICLVHGTHDTKQKFSDIEELVSRLPSATLKVFEESAHNPQLEELGKFNQELLDFVRATSDK